jgi:hypothetical protein
MRIGALLFTTILTAGCSSPAPAASSLAADFVGTWSCPDDAGGSLGFTVTASGNELSESYSVLPMGVTCTEKFTVSGSTATLVPNLTSCTAPQGDDVEGPTSASQTVSGNILTYRAQDEGGAVVTVLDEGGPSETITCTRQ